MRILASYLRALWADETGISSVEYCLLLAFIGGGIIMAADELSGAVSNEMNDTAALFDNDGTGGAGGAGGDQGDNNQGNDNSQ